MQYLQQVARQRALVWQWAPMRQSALVRRLRQEPRPVPRRPPQVASASLPVPHPTEPHPKGR
jgi:hypothetical protein